ncbi:MAG: hypothetical protein A2X36_02945 [Elusimicrobia bacterium GWA2_69_24]|nr:MAG: hypothetical protein A2X36_02945 [Elusimicrobia bacterium GWA2_69_24]
MPDPEDPRVRHLIGLALLLAAVLYLPLLGAPLLWDDRGMLVFNTAWSEHIPLRRFFQAEYFSFATEMTWRPLASLSYYAMIHAFGLSPTLLRLVGLILHGAVAALLLAFLTRAGMRRAAAGLAAALFLLHPAHLETLACVTFNEELLAALGLMAMLLCHQSLRPGLAATAFAWALLAKESGAAGLPLAMCYDFLLRRRGSDAVLSAVRNCVGVHVRRRETGRRHFLAYALYAAVLGLYAWARFLRLPGLDPGSYSALLPVGERLFHALRGFVAAARVFFVPFSLRIEYFALPAESAWEWLLWLSGGAACAALAALVLRAAAREREPLLVFLLLWPAAFLALTANLLPVGVLSLRYFAERWLYLPALGGAALLGHFLSTSRRGRGAALALILLWGGLGLVRARDWSSDDRLWMSLARIYPWSAKAHEGLGEAYFREGRFTEALASFSAARSLREGHQDTLLARYLRLSPEGLLRWENAGLYRWLGLCLLELDRPREAKPLLEKAVSLAPREVFAYRVLAYLSARTGDFPGAESWLRKGLELDPEDSFLKRLAPDVAARRLSFRAKF